MDNLIVRAVSGFAFLMLVLSVALFVPAGSVHFWQAWVYLGVFAGCSLLITAYLIRNNRQLLADRVKAGPIAEPQRTQQLLQSLAGLLFIALFVVCGLDVRFGWSDVPPLASLLSDGLVTLGFYVVFLTFRENSYCRSTIEVSAGQQVITSGPYGLVRHPMYAGAALLLVFTPVALGSWVAVFCAIVLILVIVVRLLNEERFLRAHLSGYKEYCQQVRYRLVPFVW
jgi:protein-S-isoprenylcysteine O-methyltransferase Ste14